MGWSLLSVFWITKSQSKVDWEWYGNDITAILCKHLCYLPKVLCSKRDLAFNKRGYDLTLNSFPWVSCKVLNIFIKFFTWISFVRSVLWGFRWLSWLLYPYKCSVTDHKSFYTKFHYRQILYKISHFIHTRNELSRYIMSKLFKSLTHCVININFRLPNLFSQFT